MLKNSLLIVIGLFGIWLSIYLFTIFLNPRPVEVPVNKEIKTLEIPSK
jgi:hypothetical protein